MPRTNTTTQKPQNKSAKRQSTEKTSSDDKTVKQQKKKQQETTLESEYLELKGFLSFLILHEISQKRMCGEDLAKKIGRRKGSMLTPGTIYPALKVLRRQKLIKYKRFGRKKIYHLTDEGEGELDNLYKLFSNYFWGLKKFIKREHYVAVEV